MAWTSPRDWIPLDVLTASQLDEVSDNARFIHDRGADLTVASGLITPTTQFHKVTGGGTLDNITLLGDGARVDLYFAAATTIHHNASSTGNIRLLGNNDYVTSPNEIVRFATDGTLWYQTGVWFVPYVGAAVYHDATQTPGTGPAALAFNGEDWDSQGAPFHDVTTNNTRLTVPTGLGGRYFMIGYAPTTTASGFAWGLSIRKNGTVYLKAAQMVTGTTSHFGTIKAELNVTCEAPLNAGDYVELVTASADAPSIPGRGVGTDPAFGPQFSIKRTA